MVWILVVLGFLTFLFISDKKEEVQRVKHQGGLQSKYRELMTYFMSIPNITIERRSPTSITLAVKDVAVVTRFTISHGFEDVSIFWNHKSRAFGEHSLNWKFPEYYPQSQMLSIIENEMEMYQRNLSGD